MKQNQFKKGSSTDSFKKGNQKGFKKREWGTIWFLHDLNLEKFVYKNFSYIFRYRYVYMG